MDIRVAAYGLIVRADRVLLAHWARGRRRGWTLPGGGIEPGEDPAGAAVREIEEETGYRARLDVLLGIHSHVVPAEERFTPGEGPLHTLRVVYAASIVSGERRDEQQGSSDKAEWFPLDAVTRLRHVSLVDVALRMRHERRTP